VPRGAGPHGSVERVRDLLADRGVALAEQLDDGQWNALNLADRAPLVDAEPHPEPLRQLGLQRLLIHRACPDACGVDRAPVHGAPLAVGAQHAVGDDRVGVDVGVSRAGHPMLERRDDQPLSVDLTHTVDAGA
jgi:hypothetical protein